MTRKLQEGIFYASGAKPGKYFCVLFLRARQDLTAKQAGECILKLWNVYQNLKQGILVDLPGYPVDSGNFTVLIGYGAKAFELQGATQIPFELQKYGRFRSPLPAGGGPFLIGSGLSYTNHAKINPATEEIAFQFIADTQLAVNRAVVETWKSLHDMTESSTGASPLLLTRFYTGFQRDDHRSWIDFHDGISNLRSQDREEVICIKPGSIENEKWTENGTYLTFIRLGVDLVSWRKLSRQQQELLVGRDKLSGCPLTSLDSSGQPIVRSGCPFNGTREITEGGNDAFREPPNVTDDILRMSHVQRANHHVLPASDPSSLRIFRQGYEFLESIDESPGFRAGLNFVSFQDTPRRVHRILTQPGWLGGTNFGGDPANQPPNMDKLLTVCAAGIFFVPPTIDNELFPGSNILIR